LTPVGGSQESLGTEGPVSLLMRVKKFYFRLWLYGEVPSLRATASCFG
jgi:hypothetical protein